MLVFSHMYWIDKETCNGINLTFSFTNFDFCVHNTNYTITLMVTIEAEGLGSYKTWFNLYQAKEMVIIFIFPFILDFTSS